MATHVKKAPYGTWNSPITAEIITKKSINIVDVITDRSTGQIFHLENRDGVSVLVETLTGTDLTPNEVNVRSGVHEYGGAAALAANGIVYFSNYKDGRVYKVDVGKPKEITAVTPENSVHRFGNFDIHPVHGNILVSILEDHTHDTPPEVVNTLCIIDTEKQTVSPLLSGADFYTHPKFSPDGTHLVWQQWDQPDMNWTGAEVRVAEVVLKDGTVSLQNETYVAGKSLKISAGYPSWISKDCILFTSDISGYQNPWKYVLGQKPAAVSKEPILEDFAEPGWFLGWSFYALVDDGKHVVMSSLRDAKSQLYLVNVESGQLTELETPYSHIGYMRVVSTIAHELVFIGNQTDGPTAVVKCAVSFSGSPSCTFTTLKAQNSPPSLSKDLISQPRAISLTLPDDPDPLHAVYYPPHNPSYNGTSIDGEKPPCVVSCHGGPTGMALQGLQWEIQYFTSRGWGWLDVNYRGSYGYGSAYIRRLDGQWGIVDIEDVIRAVKLIAQPPYNLVDIKRLTVRGGSSGGFTALGCISTASDVKTFAAATSMFGISDIIMIAKDTHKFELRYPVTLMGGTWEEIPEVYKERSPINSADKIVCPLLLLQGEEDKVVPKAQSDAIYDSIKKRGGIVEYKTYPGEGHGWRMEATKADALEREVAFYERVLGLKNA